MDAITQRQLFLAHVAQTSDMPMMGIDLNITKAQGVKLTDVDGKEYIDLISGISVSNIGHCHPEVIKAIHEQSQKFMHLMVYGEFNQSPQVHYAKLLTSHLPESLNCVYYTTGGSEAIEGAMKLAKRATGRSNFVSFKNSYHGSTQGALSLMSDEGFTNAFRPLLPGIKHLNYNNESELNEIDETTAAVIVEPLQAEAGVIVAKESFLKALRKRCNETRTLLIFDEIQTGFGRSGRLFAFQKYKILPDVICIAKGMGGGLPIGAFVASNKLMSVLSNNPILGHINTFGGNAVAIAAAKATLEVILKDELCNRAEQIEKLLKEHLKHSLIKELRTFGALCAIEFNNQEVNFKVCKKLIENGIITDWFLFCPTALRIAPPLIISDDDLIKACKKIVDVLNGL